MTGLPYAKAYMSGHTSAGIRSRRCLNAFGQDRRTTTLISFKRGANGKRHPDLRKEDFMIMKQENTDELTWPMGLIVETYPSDGQVRSVHILQSLKSTINQ